MADHNIQDRPDAARPQRLVLPAILLLLLAAAVWWVVSVVGGDDRVGVRRPPAPNTQVDLLPPPPPPPPPPPEEEVPPEKVDSPTPDPAPVAAPEPAAAAPAPMSIDAPATAGTDAFGLRAGSGGGMGSPGSVGTCVGPNCGGGGGAFNDSFYRTYLSSALQNALRRDKSVSRDRFAVTVLIWVDAAGRVSRADLVNGSGNAELDGRVLGALRDVASLRPPQTGVKFPQRTIVRGTAR